MGLPQARPNNEYLRKLGILTVHVCFTQVSEIVTASLGISLFAKALLSIISVVKSDCVEDGPATSDVRREVSVSVATK